MAILIISLTMVLPSEVSCAAPNHSTNDLQIAKGWIAKNQFRNAIVSLNRVIENEPKSAEAYYWRGSAHFGIEEIDQASLDLDMAIKLNPALAIAHFKKAQIYGEQGNLKMALNESGKAIALAGNKASSSWFQDRAAWFDQSENSAEAIKEFGRAIQADPTNLWAYYFRASLYFKSGLYDKALTDLNIACANQTGNGFARFCELRAKCLDKLGKHGLAEKDRKMSQAKALKEFDDFQIGPAEK